MYFTIFGHGGMKPPVAQNLHTDSIWFSRRLYSLYGGDVRGKLVSERFAILSRLFGGDEVNDLQGFLLCILSRLYGGDGQKPKILFTHTILSRLYGGDVSGDAPMRSSVSF